MEDKVIIEDREIDWKRVAKQYQLENELLRDMARRDTFKKHDISIDMSSVIKWIEDHYLFVIALTFILSYVITTTLEVFDRRKR